MKFAIGDQVIEKKSVRCRTSYTVFKVVAVLDGAFLVEYYGNGYDQDISKDDYVFEPGSRGWQECLKRFQEKELFTPEETFAELKRLDEAQNELDKEFNVVRDQIQTKLDQAAALVAEAGAMVKHSKKNIL